MRAHLIGSGIITIINIVFFVIHLKDNECIAVDENGNCESTSLSRGSQIAIVIVFALIPLLIEACTSHLGVLGRLAPDVFVSL